MKKTLILTAFCGLASLVNAQYEEGDKAIDLERYYYAELTPEQTQIYNDNHVKSVVFYTGKNKHQVSRELKFDKNGQLESKTYYRKNGNRTSFSQYTTGGIPNNITYNKKGQELKRNEYKYNSDTLLTSESLYKKGELRVQVINTYEGKKMIESKFFYQGKTEPHKVWQYEYYADGSKKTSKLYRNGKLKNVWNYECKEEGELVKAHQDTVMVCRNESVDSEGNRVLTLRKYDEKGRPRKEVYKYAPGDKIVEIAIYDNKDRRIYAYLNDVNQRRTSYVLYSKKGKEFFKSETLKNEKGQEIQSIYYNNSKVTSIQKHEYSPYSQVVVSEEFGKNGRKLRETHYTYDNGKLLTGSITTKADGKVSNTERVVYSFY